MKKLLNFRPVLFCALSLIIGILSAYLFKFNMSLFGIIISSVFILADIIFVCFCLKSGENKRRSFFAILLIFIAFIGALIFSVRVNNFETASLSNHYYKVEGRVISVEEMDENTTLAVIKKAQVKGVKTGKLYYKIALYVYGETDIDIGDKISFYSQIKDRGIVYNNRFSASDVDNKLKYISSVYSEDITVLENHKNIFEKANRFIYNSLKEGMGEREFAVSFAMLTGFTSYISDGVLQGFRDAGVAHIFAVSGLHIGFVAMALSFVLKLFNVKPWLKTLIIFSITFIYSGICGFSSSSLRAVIMSTVLLASGVGGKRYDPLTSLSISAIIILLISPVQLFRVGFMLSFTVVLGIILFSSKLSKLFKFLPRKFANGLSASLSAEIFGIPILLYYFRQFSALSVLVNVLFIPIISVVFIFLLLATIIGGLLSIESITLFIPSIIIEWITSLITKLDFTVFLIGGFSFGAFSVFYYLALILPCGLFNLRKMTKTALCFACAFICAVGTVVYSVSFNSGFKAYVSGSDNMSMTLFSNKNDSVLIVNECDYFSVSKLNAIKNTGGISNIDKVIFTDIYNLDIQVAITKLRTVFDFNDVYVYGNINSKDRNIVEKSFKNVNLYSVSCGDVIKEGKIEVNITTNYLSEISCNDKYCYIYGNTEGVEDCVFPTDKIKCAILLNNGEYLKNKIDSEYLVYYKSDFNALNGEDNGCLFLTFS